jgi:Fe2+ or Zn2+ uptake regulation protein
MRRPHCTSRRLFRSTGRKVTPQRRRIFEILEGNSSHPTAESIYFELAKDMPTVSLKTVYLTLRELEEVGEIQSLDLGMGSSRFDPNVDEEHHHLVCIRCGEVRDIYLTLGQGLQRQVPQDQFAVTKAEVVFRGLCANCRASSEAE